MSERIITRLADIKEILDEVEAVDLPDLLDSGVTEPVIQVAVLLDDIESLVFRLTRMIPRL